MQIKCNPEVYRRAAELIASGECEFSCSAVGRAFKALGGRDFDVSMYKAQYSAMFGPWDNPRLRHDGGWFSVNDENGVSAPGTHPYWNLWPTPGRQEMRMLALLLMADICEQGAA